MRKRGMTYSSNGSQLRLVYEKGRAANGGK